MTNIAESSNWSGSDDGTNHNFASQVYKLGTENFNGSIASFVLTTGIDGTVPSNEEIQRMVLDPMQWLQNDKVGKSFLK